MSMLDSFFAKGFKAAKCKTLLKLTIPRIKLLRNRREIQIKQMRREIAKLLETGQEATARIRVEHIIREEKMMAAQEIIELFCELITVRLPIVEAQRECPLDLKEAISSVCFAAPRCADLTELMQVQMMFATKYGKEFVAAATELMPECGVNRQLVELLSIRAPAPDVKLKLLKEIAEEHELDWDPAPSETELLKPHEDLLNGPTQFVSGSKLPLPKEKHDESMQSPSDHVASSEQTDSDMSFEILDFPEVPKVSPRPTSGSVSAPEMLPFPLPPLHEVKHESETNENLSLDSSLSPEEASREKSVAEECEFPNIPVGPVEVKQFVPFMSAPSLSSAASFSARQSDDSPPPSLSRTRSEVNGDLQEVIAAARSAADTAERAAEAARSAASLAQLRISELVKKKDDTHTPAAARFTADTAERAAEAARSAASLAQLRISELVKKKDETPADDNISSENPFYGDDSYQSYENVKPTLDHQESLGDSRGSSNSPSSHVDHENQPSNIPSYDDLITECDSPHSSDKVFGHGAANHQPQRLPSLDEEPYFSYPNLFRSTDSNLGSGSHQFPDNAHSSNNGGV